jgi:transcriptional regulator with XRE-family HTH domain
MLDIALDARVSPETLRKIESGRIATPAFPTIAAIAEVLGLSLDDVWAEISGPDRDREVANGVREPHERVAS